MCSTQDDAALPAPGLPIRRSTGQRLFSASPWLIAAVHVLHRLLVPRHPPRALHILTVISRSPRKQPGVSRDSLTAAPRARCSFFGHCAVFKVRRESTTAHEPSPGLSKLNSMRAKALPRSGRRFRKAPTPGKPCVGTRTLGNPFASLLTNGPLGLPRKEVIQPHLPVRLPCYDFTPIAGPTFDGSLPLRG